MPRRTQRSTPGETPLTNPTGSAVVARAEPGQSGEGFYQRIVGRKTGRPAPRPQGHGRTVPRHEAILAQHGLMDLGAADPRQGQLFAPHELPQAETAKAMAEKHGVAPPLAASRPGFMPELYEKEGGGTVSTAQAHKRMVNAITRMGDPRFKLHGEDTGHAERVAAATHLVPGAWSEQKEAPSSPVAAAMHSRAQHRDLHAGDAPWYASRTQNEQGTFDLGPGSATEMISHATRGLGVNYPTLSRAVALTSPRTRWIGGTPGTDDFTAPNLESAVNVVRDTHHAMEVQRDLDIDIDYGEIGHAAEGRALGEHKAKAAKWLASGGDTSAPIKIGELQSQKVPNFDQSLLLAHHSQAVRRQAALSYTVDSHDVRSMGHHEDLLKTPGGMAAARMTGRRSALKHGNLPPMEQSKVWMGRKSLEPEPLGEHSMLEETRSGKIRARREPEVSTPDPVDRRSAFAKGLGIEF